MTCASSPPSLSLSVSVSEMTPPVSDDPKPPTPGSGPSRTPRPAAPPRAAGRGGAERVPAREGTLASVFPAMALLLLSAVISGWDADVTRKKRGPRARADAPNSWCSFRLAAVPSPAPARCCDDCGTTKTGQWRSGPMGPATLCNTCGARRWSVGERWGMQRRHRRAAAAVAATVSDQPPPMSLDNRPDSVSPPHGQICDQGLLAPAAAPPKLVTSPPPATESLLPAMAAGSEQLPPPRQSSPPDNTNGNQIARKKPAKRKSPSPSSTTTDSLPSPPPPNRPDAKKQKKVQRKPPAKRNSPSPSLATAGTGSERPAPPPQEIPASSEKENSLPKPNSKKKKKYTAAADRQCVHCGSSETPQWRGGPDGRRSLCNACGMRHRQGRLLPEYRPQASPSFDKESHSSLHSKVLKLRHQRSNDNQQQEQPPAPAQQPQQPVEVVDLNLMPLPHPVDDHHLGNELHDGANSANNAGAVGAMAAVPVPVVEQGWLQLDPFLLDGPAAPMLVDKEWIVID